jgi:septal ring factor EnvC (AmiA/AmiB activator)
LLVNQRYKSSKWTIEGGFMKGKGAQISIALVCLVMGILLAVQFKATDTYQADLMPERVDELTQKLNTVTQQKETLEEEVLSLRDKLINVRETDKAMKDLQDELKKESLSRLTLAPKTLKASDITLMSSRSGTSDKTTSLEESILAAIIGNTAFLAPLILTCPLREAPPLIIKLSN